MIIMHVLLVVMSMVVGASFENPEYRIAGMIALVVVAGLMWFLGTGWHRMEVFTEGVLKQLAQAQENEQ